MTKTTDHSKFRFHVAPKVGIVYYYKTAEMKEYINTHDLPTVTSKSSVGKLVPCNLPFISTVKIPAALLKRYPITDTMNTSQKGRAAENIVADLLLMAPEGVIIRKCLDKERQIQGIDLVVNEKTTVQVKCDMAGGSKEKGGTGNLYVETAETNVFKMHE